MLLKRHGRFALECTHPGYVVGVHRAWLTQDNGSIWAFGKGDSLTLAVESAFAGLTADMLQVAPDLAALQVAWDTGDYLNGGHS